MTIGRAEDAVLLEDVCAVEDAEALLHQVQDGAQLIDWSGCTHLHTACLQVILASGLPVRGAAANPALAHWVGKLLPAWSQPASPALGAAEQQGA
jgi:hypothetical protein